MVAAASALVGLVGAGPALGAEDEPMAIYKIEGGKLDQKFEYTAASYSIDYASGECWRYDYSSTGSGSWNLKPVATASFKHVKGNVVKPVFNNGSFRLRGLAWTGKVGRRTNVQMQTNEGPDYDDDCQPSSEPPPDTTGCISGVVKPDDWPRLVPFHRGIPILDNQSEASDKLGLFGPMPQLEVANACPSESTFASLFGGGFGRESVGNDDLDVFERFHKHVKLGGRSTYTGSKNFIFTGLENGQGSQNASTSWALELKCVARCNTSPNHKH